MTHTFTYKNRREPWTKRERLELDLSLALDTLQWLRKQRRLGVHHCFFSIRHLTDCVRRIREAL